MDGLPACRPRGGRLHLPPHRIADEHVANDLTALKLDVADLQRRADDGRLGLAEQKNHFAVRSRCDEARCAAPFSGDIRALDLVARHALRLRAHHKGESGHAAGGCDQSCLLH
ncbi:hypothetical protein [Rhizobium anhuiense]|uniref:hypothetical protein n=1 Tax=Rhizobium anhuiense TaxID=1184720 RepID=UPI003CCA441A